ncbi:MAG: hypothetical protein SGILL_003668 [Bacillariaceae sp.]
MRFRSNDPHTKPRQESRRSNASLDLRNRRRRRRISLSHGNALLVCGTELSIATVVVLAILLFVTGLELAYLASITDELDGKEFWTVLSPKRNLFHTSIRRQFTALRSDNKNEQPIDDYYQRPHIRDTPVPLIVGGSDGSGTRAFVKVLQDLGVQMVVEDEGTLDVHAWQLFGGEGWPGLVSRVLQVTHSAVYNLNQLPNTLTGIAYADLGSMLSNIEVAADVLRKVSKDESKNPTPSSGISFGFKAPATMLLLPFFRKQLPAFKFLHVVRDGRDVAFSDNQSPVEKFYDVFYADAKNRDKIMLQQDFGLHTRSQIKAMQLWNDWNRDVYEYGKSASDGETLDVLVMRSEDLLDHKYEALLKIADFVGSTLSPQEICCLSRKENKDIGKVLTSVGADDPHVFGAQDFEAIRGRFHEFGADADGFGADVGNRRWPDIGSWGDVRAKMLAQHQNEKNLQRRRLFEYVGGNTNHDRPLEPKVHPGDNLKNADLNYNDLSRFLNRQEKMTGSRNKKSDIVRDRYGKWQQKLEGKPELGLRLHQDGKVALEAFGYEPFRTFMDIPREINLHACDESVDCLKNHPSNA